MMRSLFSGVSGLRNHQTRMDVIGNNIANVNTVGFKGSRVQFQDVLSQTITGAASAQGNRGGTNPMQVGLGMGLASIDTIFTDGSFQPTGKGTDLSIQGSGFFILGNGAQKIYTRAGNFDFDTDGNYLVPGTGYKVMGWMADNTGVINTAGDVSNIQIPVGAAMPAKASTEITYANNLSADAAIGTTINTSRDVYDSLGNSHEVKQTFVKTGTNTWLGYVQVPDATGAVTNSLREITFNTDGTLASVTNVAMTADPARRTLNFAAAADFKLDNTSVGTTSSHNFTVFGSDGMPHAFKVTFTNTGASSWTYSITDPSSSSTTPIDSGNLTWVGGAYRFGTLAADPTTKSFVAPDGTTYNLNLTNGTAPTAAAAIFNPVATTGAGTTGPVGFTTTGADPMSIALDMDITQFGGSSTVQATGQNGYAAGTLDTTSIDPSGIIVGKFTNGQSQNLAKVALATFNNPAGLNKVGENLFAESNNSGVAQVGESGTGGRGKFNPGTLEMANVDLANEFSNMIITQRGFQANSKIITVTDEMLQELANLKR
ncbi:flagellar hook protein FlgE [Anaeroselena agilis]|uniref:Flagellar hook protein FlgE n=1 Tax=Anaeroselena agilis TaxID=3063788 RepID=A0ABU3NWW6_9FIRM|nr:flagellar hook protein FlgE [Selenomonadales bacterium 4137-cl]